MRSVMPNIHPEETTATTSPIVHPPQMPVLDLGVPTTPTREVVKNLDLDPAPTEPRTSELMHSTPGWCGCKVDY